MARARYALIVVLALLAVFGVADVVSPSESYTKLSVGQIEEKLQVGKGSLSLITYCTY